MAGFTRKRRIKKMKATKKSRNSRKSFYNLSFKRNLKQKKLHRTQFGGGGGISKPALAKASEESEELEALKMHCEWLIAEIEQDVDDFISAINSENHTKILDGIELMERMNFAECSELFKEKIQKCMEKLNEFQTTVTAQHMQLKDKKKYIGIMLKKIEFAKSQSYKTLGNPDY